MWGYWCCLTDTLNSIRFLLCTTCCGREYLQKSSLGQPVNQFRESAIEERTFSDQSKLQNSLRTRRVGINWVTLLRMTLTVCWGQWEYRGSEIREPCGEFENTHACLQLSIFMGHLSPPSPLTYKAGESITFTNQCKYARIFYLFIPCQCIFKTLPKGSKDMCCYRNNNDSCIFTIVW